MSQVTLTGKFLRKLRIDKDERIADMDQKISVTPVFLNAVEHGVRKPPKNWPGQISALYPLTIEQKEALYEYVWRDRNCKKIDLSDFSEDIRKQVLDFVYSFVKGNKLEMSDEV